MTLNEFKEVLKNLETMEVKLPNGNNIPEHFHITEVGQIDKKFIDCGGTIRQETKVSFQLWESVDTWHRLTPEKVTSILELSEKHLGIVDAEIEVEYQGESIQKYGLAFKDGAFQLLGLQTDCLAKDNCGVPTDKAAKPKVNLSQLIQQNNCTPGGGCC